MSFVSEHILDNKVPYIVVVALVAFGVASGVAGQQWLDSRINHHINLRMANIETDVSDIKIILLEQRMNDLKASHCRTGSRTILNEIAQVQRTYRKVSVGHANYPLPTCAELGISQGATSSESDDIAFADSAVVAADPDDDS